MRLKMRYFRKKSCKNCHRNSRWHQIPYFWLLHSSY